MRWLADALYLIAGIVYLPVLFYQAVVLGKNRSGWRARFGGVARRLAGQQRIWVHAVSLGEVNATPKLIDRLRAQVPDCEVVVSTTTDTGFARAVALYGRERVFRYPLDFGFVVRRALERIRPTMIVLVELEVWYNLVRMATQRGIDVVVVNGRLTERSARRLGWLGRAVRPMFSGLTWVGAQDEAIAERFRRLGVATDRVEVTSSLKWDSASIADCVPGSDALAAALGLNRSQPVWVCGSTGPGEEELLLDAFDEITRPQDDAARNVQRTQSDREASAIAPALVIVPRKPERFDEVASLIERRGFDCLRRSTCPDGTSAPTAAPGVRRVILGDTMGELRTYYSIADVVFVGRTLVPLGGSDPMEVAALGKAIVVGPHTDNFQAPVLALEQAGAVRVVRSPAALTRELRSLLSDASTRATMGARARDVVVSNQGATQRTVDRLLGILRRRRSAEWPQLADRQRAEAARAVPVGPDLP